MSEDWSTRREKLEPGIENVLSFYMEKGCPCQFPRYRHIVSFFHGHFKAGPVLSLETEYSCYLSYSGKHAFLEMLPRKEEELHNYTTRYECRVCGSKYAEHWNQYSINFDCRYFTFELVDGLKELGAPVVLPAPLYGGLAGFDDRDVELCRGDYEVGTLEEFVGWMSELE